jgi:hypothetical protein
MSRVSKKSQEDGNLWVVGEKGQEQNYKSTKSASLSMREHAQ